MRSEICELIEEKFSSQEAGEIELFLERGFSGGGETAIVKLLVSAKDRGIPAARVLALCKEGWRHAWQYQLPPFTADPTVPDVLGGKDTRQLFELFAFKLGVPNPCKELEVVESVAA